VAAFLLAVLAAPDASALPADVPRTSHCFGAAAMDPALRECRGEKWAHGVTPAPAQARSLPNSPCENVQRTAPPVCAFGVPAEDATRTIALVGDSHAGHWRAALSAVARAKGWRGLSITHSSCPLQRALRDLAEPRRTSCRRWKRDVFAWFARHPEVTTVFVAGLTGGSGVVPEGGRGAFGTSRLGYQRAWRSLPSTVGTIVVMRDTPKFHTATNACVARAVSRRKAPGPACARPRAEALDPDPAIEAAERLRSPRIRTVDLARFFCDARLCYPVIGRALVLRDNTHVTGTFSATLGPYLLRAVDRLGLS
jgi:hypothetical protein